MNRPQLYSRSLSLPTVKGFQRWDCMLVRELEHFSRRAMFGNAPSIIALTSTLKNKFMPAYKSVNVVHFPESTHIAFRNGSRLYQ